ncbi:MAG: aminotransferase class I/II-fold pyridoxal phosphate-dependent enzyme [Erysipelotrichaceae bacterium]|nr:aminotransferase class I/II-fold pyridoxal phosphate-dependent enzyme [Erysipelotrichaceae bacterium]
MKAFEKRIWLSSPTMHGKELEYMEEAYRTNWMSTIGENINETERQIAEHIGTKYSVALPSGTSALHLAIKLAGEKLYGQARPDEGTLKGHVVLCSDMTFAASLNPVAYEDGKAVFIDSEYDTWNMDPEALEKAFEKYPEARLVVVVHLYGTPAKMEEIREICNRHGALIVEDAAESLGARYLYKGEWKETGALGDYNCISFNGNKIITGSSGGMFLSNSREDADKIRKWSTQSREAAPWYQHEEIGYNYRMSNVIAGVIRGQIPHLAEHIAQKKAIYERYSEGLKDLPVKMNPFDEKKSEPNYWLSCMIIDKDAMCKQNRTDKEVTYIPESGRSCPSEILETLLKYNAEGRPIWKPMHMQPVYQGHDFVCANGEAVDEDIFERGLCLPSDNKMNIEEQDLVIELIHRCFE